MVEPRGPIPRQARIPLHVGIPGEALAIAVEGEVEGIAEAAGDHLPAAVSGSAGGRIKANDKAHPIVLAEIVRARQQPVFAGAAVGRTGGDGGGHLHVVADHQIQQSVGPRNDLIHAVAVAAGVGKLGQQLPLLTLAVAVAVEESHQLLAVGGDDVDRVVGSQNAPAVPQVVGAVEPAKGWRRSRAGFIVVAGAISQIDHTNPRLIEAEITAAASIDGEADPGVFPFGCRPHQLDMEARGCPDRCRRRGLPFLGG